MTEELEKLKAENERLKQYLHSILRLTGPKTGFNIIHNPSAQEFNRLRRDIEKELQ